MMCTITLPFCLGPVTLQLQISCGADGFGRYLGLARKGCLGFLVHSITAAWLSPPPAAPCVFGGLIRASSGIAQRVMIIISLKSST